VAGADYAHAEGCATIANGLSAHSEGEFTEALGAYAHAENSFTRAIADSSHAEGNGTYTFGVGAHGEGFYDKVVPIKWYLSTSDLNRLIWQYGQLGSA
jgi:hypothetical protein